MASRPKAPSHMELLEPEPTKPQPLRIIKRSQTIAGNPSAGELFQSARDLSGSSNESFNVGSPPFGADRPLTVHKLRKKRASVLELDLMATAENNNTHSEAKTQEDNDITPKARKPFPTTLTRDFSAGAFLRAELQRGSSETNEIPLFSPSIPDRRRIKSKNFIMKAIGGRGSLRVRHAADNATVDGQLKKRDSVRSAITSNLNCDTNRADNVIPNLVLCPEITITPEVPSMESGNCTFWVGVAVTGRLRGADGRPSLDSLIQNPGGHYGTIHSMRIELFPGRNCSIPEVVGNLHELKTIAAGQTDLTLVKVRLGRTTLSCSRGSDELISDLEHQLGNALAPYLNVRITCHHSGFGSTIMQRDATGTIKRHAAHSAWSGPGLALPRTPSNPVIELIETHFPTEKARQAIRRLAEDRVQIPLAKRFVRPPGSSEGTVKPTATLEGGRVESNPFNESPILRKSESLCSFTQRDLEDEGDPARKIWTEMRRTSRGNRNHRTSVSAGTYEPMFDVSMDGNDRVSKWKTQADLNVDLKADYERGRIRNAALRNKRSVGQDTLRSMAPSTKKGSVAALGLGRNWGWTGWFG